MLPGKRYTTDDILRIARRRAWLIVLPAVIITSATAVVSRMMPDLYRSETVIQVVPQRVPDAYVRSTVTSRIEDRLQSISQQILSRNRLEGLIEDFNLYPELRQTMVMEDIVGKMRGDITVRVIKGDAFSVSYVSGDPRTAMRVTERLASLYVEENLRDRAVLADATSQFLESQLEDARRRLLEHEKRVEAYKRAHAGELPNQLASNLQVLQNHQMQLQTLSDSLNDDRDRRLMLERQIEEASVPITTTTVTPTAAAQPGGPPAVLTGTTAQQLQQARDALAALQLRLTPEHPDVMRMKRAVAELEERARLEAANQPTGPNEPVPSPAELDRRKRLAALQLQLEQLDKQIADKVAEQQRLRDAIAVYQARVEATPTRESEMVELMRDYNTLQNVYTNLLAKREDSKIAASLERRQIGEQFKVLDPARLPERPFSPNRLLINLAGLLGGLALGVGLAAILEFRDTSFRVESDVVSVLALPVVAMIPAMPTHAERRRRKRQRLALAGVTAIVLISAVAGLMMKLSS